MGTPLTSVSIKLSMYRLLLRPEYQLVHKINYIIILRPLGFSVELVSVNVRTQLEITLQHGYDMTTCKIEVQLKNPLDGDERTAIFKKMCGQ